MASSSSSSSTGVPPGFRFHPTDEELLLYYLKKKVSLEKFDLEVIREVDLNKIEPWELQERCRIGATPQNEWYFFSHKDRKYPTGSRTNRATNAGFWKATGRDKCIRTTYKKIGMRKTLVFYCGRAPHGQKTDWIMHEYRLEESDDDQGLGSEDGWVVCRVFKKKCFFKTSGSEGSSSQGNDAGHMATATSHEHSPSLYIHQQQSYHHHHHMHPQASLYKPELALHYAHPMPTNPYSQIQVQDLLPNPRPPTGYDFSVLPSDTSGMVNVDGCEQIHQQHVGDQGRDVPSANHWGVLDGIEGRFGGTGESSTSVQPMNQLPQQQQRGGEMDLWGYGK